MEFFKKIYIDFAWISIQQFFKKIQAYSISVRFYMH